MSPPQIELHAGEIEGQLRTLGLVNTCFLNSADLPRSLRRHPEIAALGEGTYVMTALSCYCEETEDRSEPGDPHALIAPFARRNYYSEAVARLKAT